MGQRRCGCGRGEPVCGCVGVCVAVVIVDVVVGVGADVVVVVVVVALRAAIVSQAAPLQNGAPTPTANINGTQTRTMANNFVKCVYILISI